MSVPESTPPLNRFRTAASVAALPVRFVAFWVATLLPLTYIPLLAAGVVTTHRLGFVALVGLNAVAFVVGHSYNAPE